MAKKANKKTIIPIVLIIAISSCLAALIFLLAISLPLISYITAGIEVTDDINLYNEVLGENPKRQEYQTKWMNDKEIFPRKIKNKEEVKDFKMVYYNPWDAQYLAYLVIDYTPDEYNNEIERLSSVGISKYIGYYSVTGFTKYELVAMRSDEYNGFIYAITDKEKNEIIYVEIIFCNYFMDLDYNKYISKDYLPDGFDASLDNPYSKKQK